MVCLSSKDFAGRYATGLVKAQEKGEVVDVDTTILSYFLMGVSNFIGLKYVMFDEDKDDNLDEVVEKVMDILEAGMFLNKKSKN